MKYILFVRYETDAERKRIDYAVERWSDRINITKPRGMAILLDADESLIPDFMDDLLSRLELRELRDRGKVQVFRAEPCSIDIEHKRRVLTYEFNVNKQAMERFLNYMLSKIGGSYEYSSEKTKVYSAYTKKGYIRIEVTLGENRVAIALEGYGDVVNFFSARIDEEMKIFLGGE